MKIPKLGPSVERNPKDVQHRILVQPQQWAKFGADPDDTTAGALCEQGCYVKYRDDPREMRRCLNECREFE